MVGGNILSAVPEAHEPSESTVAHEAFSALTALLFLQCVGAVDGTPRFAVLVRAAKRHGDSIDGIATTIADLCSFTGATMSIYTENKWWLQPAPQGEEEYVLEWLQVYSRLPGYGSAQTSERLRVQRLVEAGIDGQLVELLNALVRGVLRLQTSSAQQSRRAGMMSAVLDQAVCLRAPAFQWSSAADAFRMWRLLHLRRALDPGTSVSADRRERLNTLATALENSIV